MPEVREPSDVSTPSDEEVREQLRQMLGCSEFNTSDRNRRFLSYVIEETLAGRSDRIKAYNIAVTAFDRSEDFDPLTDPIVRIEATRLRRAVEHYYLTAGKVDRIRIDMPKGSYVATFSYRLPVSTELPPDSSSQPIPPIKQEQAIPLAKRTWRWGIRGVTAILLLLVGMLSANLAWQHFRGEQWSAPSRDPSIIVLPFENVSADPRLDFISHGLTLEIINSLTRFGDLFVYGPDTSLGLIQREPPALPSQAINANYILSGSVFSTGQTVRVTVILTDSPTSRSVWSASFERNLTTSNLLTIQSDIAENVARAIGQPYGAVFNQTAEQIASKPTASLKSYECVVKFRQRWRDYDQRDYDEMRDCLERTIEADPGYARAYASLALLDIDTHRFGFGRDQTKVDPLQEALSLARRALELDPNSTEGYLALSMAYWFSHDVEASIAAAKRGLALDPHNTDLLAELGFRYAFLEQWDLSRPLIAQAFARNPATPSGYRIANFQYYYMHGDYETALKEALAVKARYVLYGYLCEAAAYGQLGDRTNGATAIAELLKIDPNYSEHVEADLAKRGNSPNITRRVIEGLVKAGLQVSPAVQSKSD
jgi:TolB-like protein